MDEAFVIVQIGNLDLDAVCRDAIFPAISDAGFVPRRVDQHNQGDLLKSEIVRFIERSQIIVADVTNERPNCYLEVGYAMGLGKHTNLILTAREDHHHSSPNFRQDGPKVHFDLEGYDILFWDPAELEAFRTELARRIARRAAIVRDRASDSAEALDSTPDWLALLRARGEAGLAGLEVSGYMEVVARIEPPGEWSQQVLLQAVRDAEIHTFGWPIGVTLDNRDAFRPRPTSEGVEAEVAVSATDSRVGHLSYDLWKVFRDGRFYTLISLFEDDRIEQSVFWDTRVHRVTEALLFLARLYRRLGASDTDQISVSVRHAGLAGRTLRVANRMRMTHERTTSEDVSEAGFSATLAQLEAGLVGYVKQIIQPLFVIFDFFEVSDEILEQIVNGYVEGKVL